MYEENLLHLQPDFYDRFRCRAAACRHSCCKGWEIDIDENTLALYQSLSGTWREKMDAAIVCDESGAHFRLTEEERCPFLQQDGLCELIRALGEDALCDICALHPRFYELAGPYELAGLGLSCEAVCDLLLSEEGELMLRCEETGEKTALSSLLKTLGCEEGEGALRFTPTADLDGMLQRLEQTEAIDAAWPEELCSLRKAMKTGPLPEIPTGPRYDRMQQYILFRNIEHAENTGWRAVLDYAREGVSFVALQDALYGADPEHLRRWSEQIEYSTENVDLLLQALNSFRKSELSLDSALRRC